MVTARGLGCLMLGVMTTLAAQLVNADDGVVVRVMSFNVRTNYAPEDKLADCTNWDALRKENAANQIRTVAPDFVGTQETSDAQKAFFDGALAGTYAAIGRSGGSLNGNADEINAIYYKTANWKNLGDGMFWFGPNPDAPSAAWNMKYYRTAVWGRFQHIATGQTMCVFNTHYETPGNDEAQTQASLLLLAKLPTICQATDKINVITGDFNAPPTYPAMIKLFQGGLEEPSLASTYCGWGPTCDVKYDYTLHTVKDGACYTKSEVLRTSFNGCYPSDHAALLGTFCLGGSCCSTTPSPSPATNSSSSSSSLSSSSGSMYADRSATNEDNVMPGTVNAGGADAATSGENVLRAGGGGSAAGKAGTQVVNTKSTPSESGATGTVMAVLGVVGATAGVVFVVMRRKKQAIDARLDSEKAGTAPAPSYFARQQESDSNDLSPLPPSSDAALSPFRMSNSPIPTLWPGGKENRDSRSSSVSYRGPSPSNQEDPYGRDSSTAFLHDSSSNYSISTGSYDSGLQESRIHFSEAFRPDSLDSNGDALTKSQTDFALL